MTTMEHTVTLSEDCYIVTSGTEVEVLTFDQCQELIESMTYELVGRGVWHPSNLDDPQLPPRATLRAWDQFAITRDQLKASCEATGETAVAALSPMLLGLEGHLVCAVEDGPTDLRSTREFVVRQSEGWMPHHLEEYLDGAQRRAPREYSRVIDLGPAE